MLCYKEEQWLIQHATSSVAAVQSCFCFIIVAAAIVLGIGALFLLFVLLYSQRVASQSCETLGEPLHHHTQHSQQKVTNDHRSKSFFAFIQNSSSNMNISCIPYITVNRLARKQLHLNHVV